MLREASAPVLPIERDLGILLGFVFAPVSAAFLFCPAT